MTDVTERMKLSDAMNDADQSVQEIFALRDEIERLRAENRYLRWQIKSMEPPR